MTEELKELFRRAASWPEAAQEELLEIGLQIEAEQGGGFYHASAEELKVIDEALAQVERGEIATDAQVEAAFARFRRG